MGQAPPFSAPPDLNEQKRKASKTTTWIVLGVIAFCGCGGLVLMAAVFLPVFAQARSAAIKNRSLSNLNLIGVAAQIYSSDNDDRLPLGENWQDALSVYRINESDSLNGGPVERKTNIFLPPYPKNPGSYAMNSEMSGFKLSEVADPFRTILFFEAAPEGRNVQGGKEIVRKVESYFLAGMCDSTARTFKHQGADPIKWKPK